MCDFVPRDRIVQRVYYAKNNDARVPILLDCSIMLSASASPFHSFKTIKGLMSPMRALSPIFLAGPLVSSCKET